MFIEESRGGKQQDQLEIELDSSGEARLTKVPELVAAFELDSTS